MSDLVHCRAEESYPGRPLEVWHAGQWQQITEVLGEARTPSGKRFHVICDGINEFNIEYDPVLDNWQVIAVGETGNQITKERK